jgi:hypothetical protein
MPRNAAYYIAQWWIYEEGDLEWLVVLLLWPSTV